MIFGLVFWLVIIYIIIRLFSRRKRKMQRWLQGQVPLWERENIINREQGSAILSFYKLTRVVPRQRMDMVKVLTLIGSIFVGIGVIFFVASNWQRIPAHFKTALLLVISISTLYAGYYFSYGKEGFVNLGKSLLLLASLFWGATVALIGQIYNIPTSDNWYILLLWAFPIVPIACIFKNNYAHILASTLFLIWNFLYAVNNHTANYYYPLIVFAAMLPTAKDLIISRRINIIGLVIAGVYCCFFEYEWLALLISAGLLFYYLLQKEEQVYLYAASLSFIFWDITYFTVRKNPPNIYFLLPIGFILYLTYKDKIKENLALCLIGLMVWINLVFSSISQLLRYEFNFSNFMVAQVFLGAIIYISGIISKNRKYAFPEAYKIMGYLIAFLGVYLLSFRGLLEETAKAGINSVYLFASLFLLGVMGLLILDEARSGYFKNKSGRLELIALLAAVLGNLLLLTNSQALFINTLILNAVLVIFALINIFFGVETKKPGVFTIGILVFVLFIITRYIDVGWKLKEKSLFFIVGGLVILFLGTFLEKQRRKIIERM